jgi:peptide/nickel transport system permease protein
VVLGLVTHLTRRFVEAIPTVLFVIVVNFIIIHVAPGDPALALAGAQAGTDAKYLEVVRKMYGLDQPLYIQLTIYLQKVLTLDFGYSYWYQRPAMQVFFERLPASLLLMLTGEVLAIVIGILLGTYAAKRFPSKTEVGLSAASLVMYSIPVFWLGIVFLLVFSLRLDWFPMGGMQSQPLKALQPPVLDMLWHLTLPAICMFVMVLPAFYRITRASVIEVMDEDFVTTARGMGLSENAVFFRHALRNALLPCVTAAGLWFGFMFTGTLYLEFVFSWPGIGSMMYDAILVRDYPVLMAGFVFISVFIVLASILSDIGYAILDPRIRLK